MVATLDRRSHWHTLSVTWKTFMLFVWPYARSRSTRRSIISGIIGATLLVALAGWSPSAVAGPATLRIGGTGGALGGMQLLADAFMRSHPDVEIQILPSLGSGGGIRALRAGAIDIALSSRPRKQKERSRSDEEIIEVEYARTPFVFVTRPEIDVNNITSSEVAATYAGQIAAWPNGQARRLILRPLSESDTRILRSLSEEVDRAVEVASARPGMIVAVNDQENADALEAARGTFGTMTLGQLHAEGRRLKALDLDGVAPTLESLATGTYPMSKRFYLIADPARSSLAAELVTFMRSPAAAEILTASGHLPTIGR